MDQSATSKVLLVNCSTKEDDEYLARGIFEKEGKVFEGDVSANHCASLKIENKYYTALLELISCKADLEDSEIQNIISDVEALVFSFELENKASFDRIKAWVDVIDDEREIGIKLLLASETDRFKESDDRRNEILNWCIENSFELVECYQTDDNNDFPEKFGFDRVKEALHTHIWPNMIENSASNVAAGPAKVTEACASETEPDCQQSREDLVEGVQSPSDEKGLETELESFENLFSRLSEMKENAKGLSDDKRKEYAEKMAIAFWKAMGLDDDEVSGL